MGESFAAVPGDHQGVSTNARETENAGDVWSVVICCTQVISLSYEFAKSAPEEEILDTILHEIAHALVGNAHHHDDVWRTQALAIGCSGRCCHDLHFTPPRYIVQCERGCWVATTEHRRSHAMCKHCRGALVYQTYTEERWQRTPVGAPKAGVPAE